MTRPLAWLFGPTKAERENEALLTAARAEARIRREQMRPKVVCAACREEHLVDEIGTTQEWGILIRYRCPNDDPAEVSARVYDISRPVYRPEWAEAGR